MLSITNTEHQLGRMHDQIHFEMSAITIRINQKINQDAAKKGAKQEYKSYLYKANEIIIIL